MLRIYTVIIDVLRDLRPVAEQIGTHDRDLERQLRRAATSIALNCSEAAAATGVRAGSAQERAGVGA